MTHIPPLVGSVGLNSVSPRRRVPAEPRRSASAHNVKYNEGRGGVELMMMLMRMMRIKMMTAVLCFPLTLPPWSDFFHLRSCLLKYIQLSSADQRAPPRCVAPPLSHEITLFSTAAEHNTCAYCLFICKQTAPRVGRESESRTVETCIAHVPPMAQVMIQGSFCLSLIVLHGPHNVTHTSDLNNKNKWWQILVIPSPLSVFNPLSLFQPQEPQLKAVLWVLLEVGQSGPSQMSHCSGCIYFLLTFLLTHPTLFARRRFTRETVKRKRKITQCHE